MQERKRTLRVIDAKAACRAWSRYRVRAVIVAMAIAAGICAPVAARAEVMPAQPGESIQAVVEERADASDFAGQEAGEAKAEAVAPETGDHAEAAAAIAGQGGAANQAAGAQAMAGSVATGEEKAGLAADQAKEAQAAPAATASVPGTDGAGADAVAKLGSTADASTVAPTASGATSSSAASASSADAAASSQDDVLKEAARHDSDSLGTTVVFDFNEDGKTDASDWKDYLRWMSGYRPFDFDLDSGELGDSHNGGVQITGATQIIANGHGRRLDSIDTNLDVTKITRYYLNNVGLATPVKNQSPWGTCWSFASISALESAILKAQYGIDQPTYNPADHLKPVLSNLDDHGVDLSELYLAWMAYDLQQQGSSQAGEGQVDVLPPDTTQDRLACGGWATMAETLFGGWQAMAKESEQPYWPQGVDKTFENFKKGLGSYDTWGVKAQTGAPSAHVDGVYFLPDPNILSMDKNDHLVWKGYDESVNDLIKQALLKYGAVQIGYGADTAREAGKTNGAYFNYDNWAQYCDATDIEITHAVTIVGWDDDYDPANFKAEQNDVSGLKPGAWLIKNSWGSADWFKSQFGLTDDQVKGAKGVRQWGIVDPDTGEHTGYFWLSYYDHSINTPSFFTVGIPDKDGKFAYDNNYSYDYLINQSQSPFVLRTADSGTWVSNVFKAQGDEVLKAVTVHTSQPKSHAEIRVYLVNADGLGDNDPTNDGAPVASFSYDALVAGLHTVRLPQAIQLRPGQMFAVVENVTCEDGTTGSADGKSSLINLETGMAQSAQFPFPDDLESKGRAMGYVWSYAKANPGETFIKIRTKYGYLWLTPQQLSEAYSGGNVFEFGNALIKALTTNGLLPTKAVEDDGEPAISVVVSGESGDQVRQAVCAASATGISATAGEATTVGAPGADRGDGTLPVTGDETPAAPVALMALALALTSAGVLTRREA